MYIKNQATNIRRQPNLHVMCAQHVFSVLLHTYIQNIAFTYIYINTSAGYVIFFFHIIEAIAFNINLTACVYVSMIIYVFPVSKEWNVIYKNTCTSYGKSYAGYMAARPRGKR